MENVVFEEETVKKGKGKKNKGKNSTGAKIGKTIGVLFLAGLVGLGVYTGVQLNDTVQETNRAKTVIATYMESENFVNIPEEVIINKPYDEEYCEGDILAEQLSESGAQYCLIDGQYYTPEGTKIAILTYSVTQTEAIAAEVVEYNGTKIYLAPAGYTLSGGIAEKTTESIVTKVVPANPTGDYSNIRLTNVASYKLLSTEEVETLTYEAMYDKTLICDVADGTELNDEGLCTGEFRLVPRKNR